MSRPTHIAALDAALEDAVSRLDAADAEVAATLDLHLRAYDRAKEAIDAASHARADTYQAVRQCEDAIRQLGYVVLDGKGGTVGKDRSRIGDRTYDLQADMRASRERMVNT